MKDWELILCSVIVSFLVSAAFYGWAERQQSTEIDLASLEKGISTQVCTASVNSFVLLDDKAHIAYALTNISQERMDELLREHPNGKIVESKDCIGSYIMVYRE